MIHFFQNLYISSRFFVILGGIIFLFLLGFNWDIILSLAQTCLVLFGILILVDILSLFNPNISLKAERKVSQILSLGNENEVALYLQNESHIALSIQIMDELPIQLQKRDFKLHTKLQASDEITLHYHIQPLIRGEYGFGKIHLYIRSILGIVERRVSFKADKTVAVYPSIIDMKKYELASHSHVNLYGLKKIRRIGHSQEFEQIKDYAKGDDYQSINWKATGRMNRLMVNSFMDEKSQQVYCMIDKSRGMKLPFHGLSLMDYAINSALVVANTALNKQDRAGLITFSNKIDTIIKAERSKHQLKTFLEVLYKEQESEFEADYELLYIMLRKHVNMRSLIFLYANFESKFALHRVLPILRKINKRHLLVLIVFENVELIEYSQQEAKTLEQIYLQTTAQKLAYDKYYIINELEKYGIQSIFTSPQHLSVNVINKYIELKSRGMI
jgi:uncharacterized protein (DUF58 family)